MKTLRMPSISISTETEEIPVSSMSPSKVPDEKWRYVDKKGHGHFWAEDDKLPTLEWVVTGKEWVGDEYDACEYEVGEYRCRLCGEVVEPKKKLSYGPSHLPGLTWFTISIANEDFRLTGEQFSEALESFRKILREETERV